MKLLLFELTYFMNEMNAIHRYTHSHKMKNNNELLIVFHFYYSDNFVHGSVKNNMKYNFYAASLSSSSMTSHIFHQQTLLIFN